MIIRSKAPLRLGLAGGGTDISTYSDVHGGCVLNVTINMYAYCTLIPTSDNKIIFNAADRNEYYSCESTLFIALRDSLLLHKAVYNRIIKDYNIKKPLSFKLITYSDAPAGSGLGSSSTLVVAMIKAYMEWLNLPMGEYDIAFLAYQIEREDVGLSGGKQDQYAATFGGFNFIEFLEQGRVIVNPLRIKNWIKNEVENSLVLYYTGTSRESAHIIDQQIENTLKNNSESINGMHELKAAAFEMKEAILKGDFKQIADSLRRGWEAKKKTASVVSNACINEMYDYIMEHGGKSAKISGAGGGGFMMILCDPIRRFELIKALEKTNGKVILAEFTESGTQAWTLYD